MQPPQPTNTPKTQRYQRYTLSETQTVVPGWILIPGERAKSMRHA